MEDKHIKLDIEDMPGKADTKLIHFDGDLDSTNVETTLEVITNLFHEGVVNLVADFKKLRYVNSTGLGILLHISKTAKEREGHFKIAEVNENVYEIIEIIGANTLLDIYDSVEDAFNSLV